MIVNEAVDYIVNKELEEIVNQELDEIVNGKLEEIVNEEVTKHLVEMCDQPTQARDLDLDVYGLNKKF